VLLIAAAVISLRLPANGFMLAKSIAPQLVRRVST